MIVQKSLSVRGEVLLEQARMGEPMEEVTAPLKRVHGSFKLCEPAAPVLSSFIIHVTIEQVLVELACTFMYLSNNDGADQIRPKTIPYALKRRSTVPLMRL